MKHCPLFYYVILWKLKDGETLDDIGLFEFESAEDLYKKLCHDFKILCDEVNSNNYMNFILVAYHLKEWIDSDPYIEKDKKIRAVKMLEQNNINLFNDMANRTKHFKLDKPRKSVTKDEFRPGFSWDNFSWSKFNWDTKPVYIVEQDGKQINLFEECKKINNIYKEIFEVIFVSQ